MSDRFASYFLRRSRFFYTFLIAGIVSMAIVISFLSYSHCQLQLMYQDLHSSATTYTLKELVEENFDRLSEAEGRMRAYGLSHNPEFVRNYPLLKEAINTTLKKLEQKTQKAPNASQVREYAHLVRFRVALLDSVVTHKGYSFAGQKERNLFILQSAQVMEQARAYKAAIQRYNAYVLESDHRKAGRTVEKGLYMIYLGAALLVIVLIQAGVMIFKYIDKHRQAERYQRELNEQKSRFFSIISHDLRGPVHSSHALLNIMDERYQSLSEADKQLMRQTTLSTLAQTGRLLESLLKWSKAQMDQIDFSPQKVNLSELAGRVIDHSQTLAVSKQIELVNTIGPEMDVKVDVGMFEVVLRNLISNAVKFTLPGGQVTLGAVRTQTGIQISVRDTGIGMSEQVRQKIFQIGSKHTSEGTRGEKGSGFGLVLTQQFVEKHGGHIQVSSQLGEGSVFQIHLPTLAVA